MQKKPTIPQANDRLGDGWLGVEVRGFEPLSEEI
jgi:hypothetical protein